LQIDEFTAKRMIHLLARGESLPDQFSSGLPVLTLPGSPSGESPAVSTDPDTVRTSTI
jgi:hypothetical protein